MLSFFAADTKSFMGIVFKTPLFDGFHVRGVEIATFTKFEISGIRLSGEEERAKNFCTWGELRPYCFELIKGKEKPRHIKIVFSADPAVTASLDKNASVFYLNMTYNGDRTSFITGSGQKAFSLDHSGDMVWEEYITNFFRSNKINITFDEE